jgi:signal transduction histidine kinase
MMKVANLADEPCGQELLTERLLIKFEVRDTGSGISKEKLKDMFKQFT